MSSMVNKKYTRVNQDVDTSFITIEPTWKGVMDKRTKDQIGIAPPTSFCEIINGQTLNYYADAEYLPIFVQACAEASLHNKELLDNLKQNTINIAKEIRELAKKNLKKVDTLSDKEISELLTEIKKLQAECTMFGTVVAFADIHGGITNKLVEIIKKRNNLKYPLHIYTNILGNPSEKSLTEKASKDITENQNTDDLLKEYFWLNQGYIGRGLTIEQLTEIKEDHSKKEENLPSPDELLEELSLSDQEKRILQVSQDLIQIKSLRADSRQFLHVVTNKLIDILSEKWNIESKYAETLYTEEICKILNKEIALPDKLRDRWEHSIIIPETENTYKIIIGKEVQLYLDEHLKIEEIKNKNEVKGYVAQPGKVTGPIKLVFTPQHNSKVKEGDILVSTATSPQLLPAMKRAAAFVTDVGGIASHAAVISREFKTPCIVGTHKATKVIKDGDEIEVDANKGIVKVIERK